MSNRNRFLNSVSGVALTAALAGLAVPALADTDNASGTAVPGLNQNITITSRVAVEAESGDDSNEVQVHGVVQGSGAFNHLNAIGVAITGWDIEASGAFDISFGPAAAALAENRAIVSGTIEGTVLNPDFAPGTGSFGVLVADDIQTRSARAAVEDFGDGNPTQYNASVSAIARNVISASGGVVGSSIDSYGVRVDGNVEASFASAGLAVDNFFGDTNIATGEVIAENIISIEGAVGGEGASNGSTGFYVAGDVFASNASIDSDGNAFWSIPQLGLFGLGGASIYTTGRAALQGEASNLIGIAGAVTASGGSIATGVYVGGSVFAEGAWAAGEALSDGGQLVLSSASTQLIATNSVTVTGAVSGTGGPATGVDIIGDVYAQNAVAEGRAIARYGNFYDQQGATTQADIIVVASNAVSLAGTVSAGTGVGVYVGGAVFAEGATAEGFAGANPFSYNVEPTVTANATAQATNVVSVLGSVSTSDATGVVIVDDAYAINAESDAVAQAFGNFSLLPEGVASAVLATATATSTAVNAVQITGIVGSSVTNATGVDPADVYALNAWSYHDVSVSAVSVDGLGATATGVGSGLASNIAAIGGTLGSSVTDSVGVVVTGEVTAANATASGYVNAIAGQTNNNTVSTSGAVAVATNSVTASNEAAVVGILGTSVTNSAGVVIGGDIEADFAGAYGAAHSTATVTGGGVAGASSTATNNVAGTNTASAGGVLGDYAVGSYGVRIGDSISGAGIDAEIASGEGYATSYAQVFNNSGSAVAQSTNGVAGGNLVSVTGVLGLAAQGSSGVWIAEGGIQANSAYAEGSALSSAYITGGLADGDATATSNNGVQAFNNVQVTGVLGASASISTGVNVALGDVSAVFAEANGFASAYASISAGNDSDALATAVNNVSATNLVAISGLLGDAAVQSVGVWVFDDAVAAEASVWADAEARAFTDTTGGNATAIATNSATASNSVSVIGSIGPNGSGSTGVYIGEGVGAFEAFAEGSSSAYAQVLVNDADGIASATANNLTSALNSALLVGTISTGNELAVGVQVNGAIFVPVPFIGSIPVGAGAMYAFAEGSAHAEALDDLGTGTGSSAATATNVVTAGNAVAIVGNVGANGDLNAGVWVAEGGVVAAFAEAIGSSYASVDKESLNPGNATAVATGAVTASNLVSIVGTVGDANYGSYGASINQGPVGAGLAEGSGNFYASATRLGPQSGNATATIGSSATAANVTAENIVIVSGAVSGVQGTGTFAPQQNFGVFIGSDVGAVGALAEGSFSAYAYRYEDGLGSATAEIFGEVEASNTVVVLGTIGNGSNTIGDFSGSQSTGVAINGNVVALGAFATGNAYASADRGASGAAPTGTATAGVTLDTSAVNSIVITGSIGFNNFESTGVGIGEGVGALFAFAEGSASTWASAQGPSAGSAVSNALNGTTAQNVVVISGAVGVGTTYAEGSTGVWIGGGVTASLAFAEGAANANATASGSNGGSATAIATNSTTATNAIVITGSVGASLNYGSTGVYIGEGVSASIASVQSSAFAEAASTGEGVGVASATATDVANASNVVVLTGSVGAGNSDASGIDPAFVNASDAEVFSTATASANGPVGSSAVASVSASATNLASVTGSVGTNHFENVGVWIGNDVTAADAVVSATTSVTTGGSASGTGTITASARNVVSLNGSVDETGDSSTGVWIGGNVFAGGLGMSLTSYADPAAGTTVTSTAAGEMYNIVTINGDVGSGTNATNSNGVYIGGNVEFGGDVSAALNAFSGAGTGTHNFLQVIEGANVGLINGTVGTASSGSYGVYIGGNITVSNSLVSSIIITGVDATNDGTTRGVYIGGSVLTGDAENSQVAAQGGGFVVPPPGQIGDYVELAGSVFIGADGGLNPYGVAVGGGNDRVLVRDTHFQMEVVNGFDGGSNPTQDGVDLITFDTAQIFVSNIDNFERMHVTDRSYVILTNPSPYIYAVRDQVDIDYNGVLSFGDGGAPPPFPIASGAPVNAATLNTEVLTIGGINGVKTPGPGIDDSILKAENNGTGSYTINADNVYNYGTITLSKVLSAVRGTNPHGLLVNDPTSFDTPLEQQFWAVTGSWALDPTSAAGDVLTINANNYTAGSDLILDAFVFKTGSASDVAVINANVAGVTTIWVNNTNAFGPGAETGRGPTDGILLVDVNNGQDPAAVGAAFVLGNTSGWNWADPVNFPEHEMQVGAFVYDLEQGGPDGRNFYLQSNLLDQVPAYVVMSAAIQQHFYAELGTLYQRMGELRHADYGSKSQTSFFEFWGRAFGADLEMSPKSGFDFDMTTKGFMLGGDYAIRNWIAPQSRLHLGVFGGYGETKLDNIKGAPGNADGKTDGYTAGFYATYFDTAKRGQGLYADFVGKVNWLDTKYDSSTRDTNAKSDDFAWGASIEVGYGIGLGGGFIIQPQGQLSYMQVEKEKFKEKNSPGIPLEIERDKAESLRGRAGVQLQNTWATAGGTQFSPYVIANVLHEFMGDYNTTVSGTKFKQDMGGTWFNAGGGFTVDFDNVGLYGHIEYNFGDRMDGLAAGLGVKVRLGGSSPVVPAAAPPAAPVAPRKNFLVFFDFDRSNITADASRVIDEAANTAKAGNVSRIQLTAHTDRAGTEQYNMALSMRRGEAVKQELIARGIPASAIAIIARGESSPLVPTADGVREPQNRRVEIML